MKDLRLQRNLVFFPILLLFFLAKKALFVLFEVNLLNFDSYTKMFYLVRDRSEIILQCVFGKLRLSLLDSGMTSPLIIHGSYDQYNLEFLKKKVKKRATVVDIGAHVGFYTIFLSKLVGEDGKVFSFEPDNYNYSLLVKNIQTNSLKNVKTERIALSSLAGRMKFYMSMDNFGDHQLYKNKVSNEHRKSVIVQVETIDRYFRSLRQQIDFIKIDVQGLEPLVVRGMLKTIQKQRHIGVLLELWPEGYVDSGQNPARFVRHLLKLGFSITAISRNGLIKRNIRSYIEIQELLDGFEFVDLYCEK